MSGYKEDNNHEYMQYERVSQIDNSAIASHREFNIWHEIQGYIYYARPLHSLIQARDVRIVYNYLPVMLSSTNSELSEIYVSPIIRYCSQKRWPARHSDKYNSCIVSEVRITEPLIVLAWSDDIHNYYHLLFDLCLKLELVSSNIELEGFDIAIIGPYNELVETIIESLFPETTKRLKFVNHSMVELSSAIFPITPQPSYMDISGIKALSTSVKRRIHLEYGNIAETIQILYVVRGKGKNGRSIVNEESFAESLRYYLGAHIVRTSELPAHQQWNYFYRARVIIGAHGAALSNLLAAREGTRLIELLPESYRPSTFSFVAAALNVKYSKIVYNDENHTIPVDNVLVNLRQLLS